MIPRTSILYFGKSEHNSSQSQGQSVQNNCAKRNDGELNGDISETPDLPATSNNMPTKYTTDEENTNMTPVNNPEIRWSQRHAPQ